ncbi:MAG: TonB family protein [Pyrinomonadaceae bacterium]
MLDKLIESKNNGGENRRLSGFLLTTFLTVVSVLTFGLIYSLFSQTLAMGSESLDVSTLVAPITIVEQSPPPEPRQNPQPTEKTTDKAPSRIVNMQRPEESPIKPPDSVSVSQNKYQARPNFPFVLKNIDSNPAASTVSGISDGKNTIGLSGTVTPTEATEKMIIEKPPIIKQTVKPIAEKSKTIVTGGVVNSKAINLVKPIYSAAARAIRAGGEVKVQVTIDEDGNVISAKAINGHPLLRDSAVNAAKSSKFTPTTLSKQKVKVTGIIIYNFAVQ